MDAEYSTTGASVSSRVPNSLELNQDVFSEDVAWADSCLINDPEDLNGNWSSLRGALLDIIDNRSGYTRVDMDFAPSMKENEAGPMEYSFLVEKEADRFLSLILEESHSETCMSDLIRGKYNNATVLSKNEAGVSSLQGKGSVSQSSLQYPILHSGNGREQSAEGVYEMITPTEEEDERARFVNRLKKALAAVSIHSLPSTMGDSSLTLRNASLDDLITGIRYLSMSRASS